MRYSVNWYLEGQHAATQSDNMLKDARGVFYIICDLNGLKRKGYQALDNYREFLRGWISQRQAPAVRDTTTEAE